MTRESIVDFVAQKAEMTKKQASAALKATLEAITKSLKSGERVTFIGFGTFAVVQRKARTGINPRTKEKIKIKATKAPVFRPGSKLKALIKK